jgi:hypothetical protein
MPENPYAVAARLKKADALLKVIRDAGITPADMGAANDGHWLQLASLAEVNIPGAKPRAAVLARLKEAA